MDIPPNLDIYDLHKNNMLKNFCFQIYSQKQRDPLTFKKRLHSKVYLQAQKKEEQLHIRTQNTFPILEKAYFASETKEIILDNKMTRLNFYT